MRRLRTSVEVAAPAAAVWELLTELRHWPRWGSTVRAVESDAERVAPGVTGRVQTVAGFWLPFAITDVAPGSSWSWRVAGIPATGHEVAPLGPDRCRATFTVPWPAAPYLAALRLALRKLRRLAEG